MFTTDQLPKTVLKKKMTLGRGEGSKKGKNCGRGHKGQNKRGKGVRITFEGGQQPLVRRTPKFRGFKPLENKQFQQITLSDINKAYDNGETVSLETLLEKGVISSKIRTVRIIKTGNLDKKLTFKDEKVYLTSGVKELVKA